jgi:hypothetical protein
MTEPNPKKLRVLEQLPVGWSYAWNKWPNNPGTNPQAARIPTLYVKDHEGQPRDEVLPHLTKSHGMRCVDQHEPWEGRADQLYWSLPLLEQLNERMTNGGLFLVPEGHLRSPSALLCAGILGRTVPFLRIYVDGRTEWFNNQ